MLRRILLELMPLILSLPARVNFKEMSRYGQRNESTYHNWFKCVFDLVHYNTQLIEKSFSDNCFVVFDPSYLPKSGHHSPNLGRFWSGQAGQVKRGLELRAFGVVDVSSQAPHQCLLRRLCHISVLRKVTNLKR
jgi:hypothetical protein